MPGPGPTTQNSSPPQRATTSVARVTSRSASADGDDHLVAGVVAELRVDRFEPGDLDEDAVRRVALAPSELDDLRRRPSPARAGWPGR